MAQVTSFPTNPSPLAAGTAAGPNAPNAPTSQVISMGGIRAVPLAVVEAEKTKAAENEESKTQPIAAGAAGVIRTRFEQARQAKRNVVEDRLLSAIRARRGEYDTSKLSAIRQMGGSEVFAGLTSTKCRAAGGWIRDVMMGTGIERPWTVRPTPLPDLPPQLNDIIVQQAMGPIKEALQQGITPSMDQVTQMMSQLKDQAIQAVRDEATKRADRMADKMEDQLIEGGFLQSLDAFIDDLVTYPTAFLKGPVIRMRNCLAWGPGHEPIVTQQLEKTWERVSPFDIYPAPGACNIQDGFLIEKHRLSRQDLNEMLGVEGFSEEEITDVIEEYGRGGLNSWMFDKSLQDQAEGKDTTQSYQNPDGLIDALQYWGSMRGQDLIDWGLTKKDIPDPTKEYHIEAWLIGTHVIKAVLNYDPLNRKPYYAASYERVPGNVWGNSIPDLVRDPQDIVNACARAMVNNMALSSGPQVGILVDRMAAGEDVTQLSPWRIWQMKSDPLSGTTQQPIEFFQPQSNVVELMQVFDKFSALADEYSGIPKYLSGDTTGGAGRTASGLSMLINNASKSIKQVISNIDIGVLTPLLERLYYHNMRYEQDPDLKGDVHVLARGAASVAAKEAAQQRRNEFLATTANPIDFQIMGADGRAAVLREVAKALDMDTDKVVPSVEQLHAKAAAAQALLAAPTAPGDQAAPGGAAPPANPAPNVQPKLVGPSPAGQNLMDGAPITDHFSPPRGT